MTATCNKETECSKVSDYAEGGKCCRIKICGDYVAQEEIDSTNGFDSEVQTCSSGVKETQTLKHTQQIGCPYVPCNNYQDGCGCGAYTYTKTSG